MAGPVVVKVECENLNWVPSSPPCYDGLEVVNVLVA